MEYSTFSDILILFAGAVSVVVVFLRLNFPPILGYLLAGVLMGPYGLAWVDDTKLISAFAEFGVVFLLFTIGLEFSLPQLIRMRGAVLGLGGSQVILTTVITAFVAYHFGFSFEAAVVLGGVIAMSSTALVVRQLSQQVEIHSRHGKNAIGILLFQDLAVIPFLILVASPISNGGSMPVSTVLMALGEGMLAMLIILVIGRWILRPMFRSIARFKSTELFTLTVLLVTISAAGLTHNLGMSLALGGFLAGMMLGETEFRHQIEAEIRPFRDVLLGLFFITIGMQLNVGILLAFWPSVLLFLTILIFFKFVLVATIVRFSGYESAVALRTGLVLAHGGEFGFAVLTLALANSVFPVEFGQILLAALLISMGIAPILIRFNQQISNYVFPSTLAKTKHKIVDKISKTAQGLNRHVIICGYGRVGQNVAHFIEGEGIKYLAVDLDQVLVRNAINAKEPVSYGDAASLDILKSAGLSQASAVVITINEISATFKILHNIRLENKEIPIIVRAADDSYLTDLQSAGATEVIPETLEASLMLSSSLLLKLKVPMPMVYSMVHQIRRDRYSSLHHVFPGEGAAAPIISDKNKQLTSIALPEGLENIALKDTGLDTLAVTVTAIQRDKHRINLPSPETILLPGDLLLLFATPIDLDRAETLLMEKGDK